MTNLFSTMNEDEIATKRTIMVNIGGVLVPRQIALKRHNKNKPKKTKIIEDHMTDKLTNEDSESRALRSNEYSLHNSLKPASVTKVRLKNKETGGTVGIFKDHREATAAHAKHPMKHKLYIESFYMDKLAFVRDLMIEHVDQSSVVSENKMVSVSEYREIFDEQVDLIESQIEEKKQLLLDKKKVVNGIEVDSVKESVFDWKKPVEKRPDWSNSNVADKPKAVKPAVDPDAPKRGRGRPAGKYGSYKVKDRSADDKKAIADKVHSNPERKANYDAAIAARKEFKKLMDDAIKAKQANAK